MLSALLGMLFAAAETTAADTNAAWRFRIGPVLEVAHTAQGLDVTAVRPLYSRVAEPAARESLTDVVWPWSSFHRRNDYFHWWALPAFGKDEDVNDPHSRHTFWLLPVYCEGRTRTGEDFAALFPFGGDVRDLFGLDELSFILFPLHVRYRQGSQQTEDWLWPIYRRETGPKRDRIEVFPLYGDCRAPEQQDRFVLWPIWNEHTYNQPHCHGTSAMLFPVYGCVDTDAQHGWMALPPFFSRMEMDGATQLRCPWPFYQVTLSTNGEKRAYWPFWERTETTGGRRGNIGWPFWWTYERDAGGRRERSRMLVPFYCQSSSERRQAGGYVSDRRYLRIWPLCSRDERPGGTRWRVLELTFMKDGHGIERNWAPFWSLYVQQSQGEACDHDLLWGLARWGRQRNHTAYGQAGWLASWDRPVDGEVSWRVLGGLLGCEGQGKDRHTRWLWFGDQPKGRAGPAAPPYQLGMISRDVQ